MIRKELVLDKGSGIPNKEKVGNISIEQVIKIAKMKQDSMFVNDSILDDKNHKEIKEEFNKAFTDQHLQILKDNGLEINKKNLDRFEASIIAREYLKLILHH